MKTTKRSKMLLSSIAMLLVALVALGSATFAWYTLNRHVDADSVTVTASAPGGLKISNDNSTYGTQINIKASGANLSGEYMPSSLLVGTNGTITSAFYADASADNAYGAASGKVYAVPAGSESTFYTVSDSFYVKSTTGKTETVELKVGLTAAVAGSYASLAIVDKTAGKVYYVNSDGQNNGIYTSTSAVDTTNYSFTTATTAGASVDNNITFVSGTEHEFVVVAYVDGMNSNCVTTTVNTAGSEAGVRGPVEFNLDFDIV